MTVKKVGYLRIRRTGSYRFQLMIGQPSPSPLPQGEGANNNHGMSGQQLQSVLSAHPPAATDEAAPNSRRDLIRGTNETGA